MTSIEQKNKNILSRFENDKSGSKICVFNIKTKCGKNPVMISMDQKTETQAEEKAKNIFGDNYESIKARA